MILAAIIRDAQHRVGRAIPSRLQVIKFFNEMYFDMLNEDAQNYQKSNRKSESKQEIKSS